MENQACSIPLGAEILFRDGLVDEYRKVDYKSTKKLVSMRIEDFLAMAEHVHGHSGKSDATAERIITGGKFDALPFLSFDTEGVLARVHGHEGRHRAMALRALGYEYMPVLLCSNIRWSEQQDQNRFDYVEQWPEILLGEDGNAMRFPVKRAEANGSYQGVPEKQHDAAHLNGLSGSLLARGYALVPHITRTSAQVNNLSECIGKVLTWSDAFDPSPAALAQLVQEIAVKRSLVPVCPRVDESGKAYDIIGDGGRPTEKALMLAVRADKNSVLNKDGTVVLKLNGLARLEEIVLNEMGRRHGLIDEPMPHELLDEVDRFLVAFGTEDFEQNKGSLRGVWAKLHVGVGRYLETPPLPLDDNATNAAYAHAREVDFYTYKATFDGPGLVGFAAEVWERSMCDKVSNILGRGADQAENESAISTCRSRRIP